MEIAAVYAGFAASERRAIEEVRGWVRAVVFGGNWRFSDPEATVQDVLLRLLRNVEGGRVDDPQRFQKFVWAVAKNVCIDVYHRERRRRERETPADEETAERIGASGAGPHDDAEQHERYRLAVYIYQRLPPACRDLWDWVYAGGLSAAQVGERLGISAGNARVRVHRCLEKGRAIFAEIEAGRVTP